MELYSASIPKPFIKAIKIRAKPSSRRIPFVISASKPQNSRIVTVLGKGGVGKTTASVLLAKYFALTGRKTCLVVQSDEDRSADDLLGIKLTNTPTEVDNGMLSAVRIESTKTISAALDILKKADAKLGLTQGALEEVSGDELSVLPGLDPILAVAVLERLARPAGGILDSAGPELSQSYDVVVFDGASSGQSLRLFGSPERARWYLRRFRSVAEKTDIGRVTLPSAARLVDGFINGNEPKSDRTTSEIWSQADLILTKAVESFADPKRFSAYLIAVPDSQSAVSTAQRLWGGALQAGITVSGILFSPAGKVQARDESQQFAPLPAVTLPQISEQEAVDWESLVGDLKEKARGVLEGNELADLPPAISVNGAAGSISVFLPGFEKSEVRLSQWREKSELLVEVGDQRRSIAVPESMRGKVSGAKFQEKTLVVTFKKPK